MGKGYLKVNLYVGNDLLPVQNTKVLIKSKNGSTVYDLNSDRNGKIENTTLDAPDITASDVTTPECALYDVEIHHPAFMKVIIHDVEIFDKETTVMPVQMHPYVRGMSDEVNTEEFFIPTTRSVQECSPRASRFFSENNNVYETLQRILANEVAIPDYITVHLGSPNDDSAENYRLPFIDYLKNVASREVFPSWTEAALTANILAQMTFALNRIYTTWYPSRGKNFDITNRTQWDQAFDKSKGYFEVMGRIVDKIFTNFIRRQGRREPFFSSYCNGTTAVCDGLSQCGSQELGLAGYSYLQILMYYYPNDIQIVESNNFAHGVGLYPGTPLREGSSGEDVRRMQIYLNRLSGNWFITPIPVQNLNGFYGVDTKTAVTMFQQNTPFGLAVDGVIGKSTWNAITLAYTAATELGELTSEGQRIGIGAEPPNVTLYPNTNPVTRGKYVVELQFLLNYISQFYPNISPVIQNGVFRDDTKRGVIYFQQHFGIAADGIVGPATWRALYDVFKSLQIETPAPPPTPEPEPEPSVPAFPGTPLRLGSQGSDVILMQNYLNAIAKVYPAIPTLVTDGIFGPLTDTAVRAFQRQFGLTVDGIIGQITWYRIIDIYNTLTQGTFPQFPGTNLTVGSRGNDVLLMQNFLNAISKVFPVVVAPVPDGIFGTVTAASVRAFQSLFGLTVDGVIGLNTWDKIIYVYNSMPTVVSPEFPGTSLRVGSQGNNVTIMQKYLDLIATKYPSIPRLTADGIFGPGTERSVIAFQKEFNLASDGVIGLNTWNAIVSVYNILLMNTSANTLVNAESASYSSASATSKGNNSLSSYALLFAVSMLAKR